MQLPNAGNLCKIMITFKDFLCIKISFLIYLCLLNIRFLHCAQLTLSKGLLDYLFLTLVPHLLPATYLQFPAFLLFKIFYPVINVQLAIKWCVSSSTLYRRPHSSRKGIRKLKQDGISCFKKILHTADLVRLLQQNDLPKFSNLVAPRTSHALTNYHLMDEIMSKQDFITGVREQC
jgi:hypothetical protein